MAALEILLASLIGQGTVQSDIEVISEIAMISKEKRMVLNIKLQN